MYVYIYIYIYIGPTKCRWRVEQSSDAAHELQLVGYICICSKSGGISNWRIDPIGSLHMGLR